MNILTTYFTASRLFTFVREGMMYVEFNSVTLFTVLYSRFLNCAKDVSKVTAQPTILTPQPLRAVGVLFSPMVSGWAGGCAGGGKIVCPGCISETVRCRKLILGRDIG